MSLALPLSAAQFEGVAPLGSAGVEAARSEAIRDALLNAGLAAGASVRSNTSAQGMEQLEVRAAPVGEYRLLSEWEANGFWHVKLDVQAAATAVVPSGAGQSLAACTPDRYRRKVLLTHFYVQQPGQVVDLMRVPENLQAYLARQLQDSGRYLPQQAAYQAAFQFNPRFVEPQQLPARVHELAVRYNTQFVVGGIIRDAGASGQRVGVAADGEVREGERKQVLNVPGAHFLRLGIKTSPKDRRFDIETFIYDGISGALLNRQLFPGQASGEVAQAEGTEFAGPRFFATDYGRMVEQQLQQVLGQIDQSLSCLPMTARVVRVEGRQVYVDAGGQSGLRPGDQLRLYRLQPGGLPVDTLSTPADSALGLPEQRSGVFRVAAVQPLFAVGTVEGSVQAGDYVRVDSGKESRR